jgi:hypothetical protein
MKKDEQHYEDLRKSLSGETEVLGIVGGEEQSLGELNDRAMQEHSAQKTVDETPLLLCALAYKLRTDTDFYEDWLQKMKGEFINAVEEGSTLGHMTPEQLTVVAGQASENFVAALIQRATASHR